MMEIVTLKNGETVNIDTFEGAKAYLIDQGFDYDEVISDGLKVLEEIKKKIDEET